MKKQEDGLIYKSELLHAIHDKYVYDDCIPVLSPDFLYAQREILQLIMDFPTIDPESTRPHGMWTGGYQMTERMNWFYSKPKCTNCGKENDAATKFCPHCGAKMGIATMIRLQVEKYCHNCPEFEAQVEKEHCYTYKDGSVTNTTVTCEHRSKCECIRECVERSCEND